MAMKAKRVLMQVLAGLAVASLSTLVMAPLSAKSLDPQLALTGLALAVIFCALAMLVQR
jgi:gas vesicle protein